MSCIETTCNSIAISSIFFFIAQVYIPRWSIPIFPPQFTIQDIANIICGLPILYYHLNLFCYLSIRDGIFIRININDIFKFVFISCIICIGLGIHCCGKIGEIMNGGRLKSHKNEYGVLFNFWEEVIGHHLFIIGWDILWIISADLEIKNNKKKKITIIANNIFSFKTWCCCIIYGIFFGTVCIGGCIVPVSIILCIIILVKYIPYQHYFVKNYLILTFGVRLLVMICWVIYNKGITSSGEYLNPYNK